MHQNSSLGGGVASSASERLAELWRSFDSARSSEDRRRIAEGLKALLGLNTPESQAYLATAVAKRMDPSSPATRGLSGYIAFAQYKLLITTRGVEELVKLGQSTGAEVLAELDRLLEGGKVVVSGDTRAAYTAFVEGLRRAKSRPEGERVFDGLLKALGLDSKGAAQEADKTYSTMLEDAHREVTEDKRGIAFELLCLVLFLGGLLIGELKGHRPTTIDPRLSMKALYSNIKKQILELRYDTPADTESTPVSPVVSAEAKAGGSSYLMIGLGLVAATLLGGYIIRGSSRRVS